MGDKKKLRVPVLDEGSGDVLVDLKSLDDRYKK